MTHSHVFSGGVFSDTIDGGRAGAEIELRRGEIFARTPDGHQFSIAYSECQLEIGGFSERMIFCRNADRSLTVFCEERDFPQALSDASFGLLSEQIDATVKKGRSDRRRGRRIALVVAITILVFVVGGFWTVRMGARAAARALPVSVDKQIGQAAFKSMELGGPEVKDPVVVDAVRSMVDQLAPHSSVKGMDFQVHVIDSPTVNAFALPGGNIVVFTGLIEKTDQPEQVAGVLAHEMAHVTLRHGMERIADSIGVFTAIGLLLGDTGGFVASGGKLFALASINSYSRQQESAADAEGTRILHEAGIDPLALGRFLDTVSKEEGGLPGIASWMSSHPQHEQRIAAIEALQARLPEKEYQPLGIDWDEVRGHVARNRF